MAGDLHLHDVDDDLVARLQWRALRNGRSVEAEHREILRQALAPEPDPSFDVLAAELGAMTAGREHTPSQILQREGREEQ